MIRALQWLAVIQLAIFTALDIAGVVMLDALALFMLGSTVSLTAAAEALLELRGQRRDPRDELPDLRALSDTGPGD